MRHAKKHLMAVRFFSESALNDDILSPSPRACLRR
jgi:hypothetical protein